MMLFDPNLMGQGQRGGTFFINSANIKANNQMENYLLCCLCYGKVTQLLNTCRNFHSSNIFEHTNIPS